jgi:DNA polymerase-3 subunit epsilon
MRNFVAIDFETGNPKRVSACALGYAWVKDGKVVESFSHLIKPIGGHAPFQSKIHGIKDEHTFDKPNFGELFPKIQGIFRTTLVAHSLFDQQVLLALSDHFGLGLKFEYVDTSAIAKQRLPELNDHKLKTLAKHFGLPRFKHHDAQEDAVACANICLRLHETTNGNSHENEVLDEGREFKGLICGILADEEVNYKESYELLYWLQDHTGTASVHSELYATVQQVLEDDRLDHLEAELLRRMLSATLQELG